VKGDVGSISQNHIQSDIAQQMADEIVCCDIDEFLCHYAPFCPTDDSIDSALEKLEHEGLLHNYKCWNFSGNNIPSQVNEKETAVFKRLEDIVEALTEQPCSGTDSKAPRKCNFNCHNCGNTQMDGEIAGPTFRIDGYFSPLSCTPLAGKVVVSQVAVAAEFKKKDDIYDVRIQILTINVF